MKRSPLTLSLVLFCLAIFGQNDTNSDRSKYIEIIVSAKGDFNYDSVKVLREKLPIINVIYKAYCVDQKCLIVAVPDNTTQSKETSFAKMQSLMPGCFLGIKEEPINDFILNCRFATKEEAAEFKQRLDK